jgi:hypothetical protein
MPTVFKKTCPKCKQERALDQFSCNRKRKDGYDCYCKECVRGKGREWYQKNKDRRAGKNREYYKANCEKINARIKKYTEDNPGRTKDRQKEWAKANPDKLRNKSRRWREKNPAKVKEINRRWTDLNPDKVKAKTARRYERLKQAGGNNNARKKVRLLCGGACLACGLHNAGLDHIIPLIKGGKSVASNYQCLCVSCNAKKGIKATDFRPASPFITEPQRVALLALSGD